MSTKRARPKTNVAASPGSLVGRVDDLRAIAACFDEGARLVTIVGHGGMGKTRVALELVGEQAAAYSTDGGGAWFCDLTEARSVGGFCAVVAGALGITVGRGADDAALAGDLARAVARRGRILLVLDNCEQLLALAPATLGVLLELAPSARILATSRVSLDLAGEHLWPLPGLSLPLEASELFLQRARQVRPGYRPTEDELAEIRALVQQLDGIPLAIELAATRMGVLSPAQIRQRLSPSLELLVRRGEGGRHGSMREVILDSHRLLGDAERACLARCSVFRGGFTLDAAEHVVGASALGSLDSLRAQSLLRVAPETATRGGPLRFSLSEPIRSIAAEQLASMPEAADVVRRHCEHYGTVAASWAKAQATPTALALVSSELENLVAAHRTAIETGAADAALAIALALAPLLRTRGLFALRLRLLDEALHVAGTVTSREARAEALAARGHARRELGDLTAARADLEAALLEARACEAPLLESLIGVHLGELVETLGATDAARAQFARSIERARSAQSSSRATILEAEARRHLAHALRREGRLDLAGAEIAAATALHRSVDHHEGISSAVFEAGVIALFRGRHELSRELFDEALGLARKLGAKQAEGDVLTARGTLLQELGDLDGALRHHTDALAIFRDVGNPYHEGSTLYYTAGAYLERGQLRDAETLFARSLAMMRALGSKRYEALGASVLATLAADRGDVLEGHALLEIADHAAEGCSSEPSLLATLAIHRLHVEARGRDDTVRRAREIAASQACDDPRFALRVLERALDSAASRSSPPPLAVHADGAWFRLGGAAHAIDLSRRLPLGRLLCALVRRRIDAPGEPVPLDDLILAAWPGERIRYEAGVNRAHVALNALRRLGLRSVLVRRDGGYCLDAEVGVQIEDGAKGG